ncbi:MAG: PilZ domain-containing protein [Candidatus Sulfotelmatobacter sp.]
MSVLTIPARQPRAHYRHELRTLTYVTLDQANGGIVRNLNHEGVAVQAVAPLREQERVRVSFELRFPRLAVEAYGQVSWSTPTGQCGIRFVDLPARTRHQINEWIFSNLLDAAARDAVHPRSMFAGQTTLENDGLTLSALPKPPITLDPVIARKYEASTVSPVYEEDFEDDLAGQAGDPDVELNWFSRPLCGRTLARMVDGLVMFAGLLLFALIFLSVAHELPQWPLTLYAALAAAVFVVATYRILFAVFGRASLGACLARTASGIEEKEKVEESGRFR